MKHRMIGWMVVLAVGLGLGANASGGAEPSMAIQDFVHQFFVEGVPYAQAAGYGPEEVPILLDMLNDPREKPYWSNIAVTLGIIGDDRAVDPLIRFIEGVDGSVGREDFAAKSSAIMALGYLLNKSPNEKALNYLKNHMTPEGWRDSPLATAQGFRGSEDERTAQLSTLAVIGLALSGRPEAKEALLSLEESLGTMGQTPFANQASLVVSEALKTHDIVMKEGLAAYYQNIRR